MPLDAVVVLVVQHGQAGLVVELLQTLDGDAYVVLRLDRTLLDALIVVRLRLALLSALAPVGDGIVDVGAGDSLVAGARPEPALHVDWLKVSSVTAFVLEVALSSAGPYTANVIFSHDLLEHVELAGPVEGDEVHAPVPAEVSPVEPVPVLKLVPGLAPGEEVVVLSHLHVRFSFHTLIQHRSV